MKNKNKKRIQRKTLVFNILAIVCIILFCVAISPVTMQNDTYYTVKVGESIVENGIDGKDHFSWHENLNYEYLPLSSNQIQNLSIYIYCNYTLTAPLEKDSSIGTLAVNIDDKNIITLNIKNGNSISKMTYKDFFKNLIKNYPYCLESIIFNK